MNYTNLIKTSLPHLIDNGTISFSVPLSRHSSFKIGGPAEIYCTPTNQAQLIELLVFCLRKNIPYFILGRGSNLLISDKGLPGMVINTNAYTKITKDDNYLSAFCGVSLNDLCDFACEHGLAGLEFASGIPGSVGGAVYMNAGAYEGEIKDVLYCSKCLSPTLESLTSKNPIIHLKAAEHEFAYRYSALQSKNLIHLSSVFKLFPDSPESIRKRMDALNKQRWDKQPMDLPSAGSVFKRPEGHFTGKLVNDCGLRGFRIGDAAVSDKHCGFIVNLGKATADEVLLVIRHVQRTVSERFGVKLQTEIRMLGDISVDNFDVSHPVSVESLQHSPGSNLSTNFKAARTTHGIPQPQTPRPSTFVVHSAEKQETHLKPNMAESTPNLQTHLKPNMAESTPSLHPQPKRNSVSPKKQSNHET